MAVRVIFSMSVAVTLTVTAWMWVLSLAGLGGLQAVCRDHAATTGFNAGGLAGVRGEQAHAAPRCTCMAACFSMHPLPHPACAAAARMAPACIPCRLTVLHPANQCFKTNLFQNFEPGFSATVLQCSASDKPSVFGCVHGHACHTTPACDTPCRLFYTACMHDQASVVIAQNFKTPPCQGLLPACTAQFLLVHHRVPVHADCLAWRLRPRWLRLQGPRRLG